MPATEKEVIEHLDNRGELVSKELFNALFRAWVTTAFEWVVIKPESDGLKVALGVRPEDDTEFPGMLHVPGTVMRRGDTRQSALGRIQREDLEGVTVSLPRFVDVLDFQMGNGPDQCSRGQVVERLYVSIFKGGAFLKPTVLADVSNLPIEKFGWPYHRHLITRAVQFYNETELG